jgi:hypothetical protein
MPLLFLQAEVEVPPPQQQTNSQLVGIAWERGVERGRQTPMTTRQNRSFFILILLSEVSTTRDKVVLHFALVNMIKLSRAPSFRAFHCEYFSGKHAAQGRYPAAMAISSSTKNTRFPTYPPRARVRRAVGQSSLPYRRPLL